MLIFQREDDNLSKDLSSWTLGIAEGRRFQKEGLATAEALGWEHACPIRDEQRGQNEAQWLAESEERIGFVGMWDLRSDRCSFHSGRGATRGFWAEDWQGVTCFARSFWLPCFRWRERRKGPSRRTSWKAPCWPSSICPVTSLTIPCPAILINTSSLNILCSCWPITLDEAASPWNNHHNRNNSCYLSSIRNSIRFRCCLISLTGMVSFNVSILSLFIGKGKAFYK